MPRNTYTELPILLVTDYAEKIDAARLINYQVETKDSLTTFMLLQPLIRL